MGEVDHGRARHWPHPLRTQLRGRVNGRQTGGACARGRLASACDRCGSALELTRPAGVTARDLRTLRRVARWQGFDLLDDATSWMLQDLPE